MVSQRADHWVLISYRVPREPSTPRIAIWRRLRQLGVVQIGDGLVALPAEPRTIEHLEWVAEQVVAADGEAIVWTASPTSRSDGQALARTMSEARDDEYRALIDEIETAARPVESRTLARWRREWRRIDRRDYFDAGQRDVARLALDEIANEAMERTSS